MRSCGKNLSRWLLQQKEAARNLPPPTRAMSHRTLNNHGFGVPLGPDTQPPELEDVADNVEPQTVVGDSDMAQPVQEATMEVGIFQFHWAAYL